AVDVVGVARRLGLRPAALAALLRRALRLDQPGRPDHVATQPVLGAEDARDRLAVSRGLDAEVGEPRAFALHGRAEDRLVDLRADEAADRGADRAAQVVADRGENDRGHQTTPGSAKAATRRRSQSSLSTCSTTR